MSCKRDDVEVSFLLSSLFVNECFLELELNRNSNDVKRVDEYACLPKVYKILWIHIWK